MKKNLIPTIFALAAALLFSVSCKKDNPAEKDREEETKEETRIAVESIRLDKEAISLEIDEEGSCTVTATAEGGSKSAVCVVTVKAKPKESLLEGRFSVSQEKKVQFSKGNLFFDGSFVTPSSFAMRSIGYPIRLVKE